MTQPNPLIPSQEARSLLAVLNITVRDEDALVAIGCFEQAIRRDEAEQERAAVLAYLRAESERGAELGIAADKGTNRRAALGGGSLALHRAAENIEAGEHFAAALRARHAGESPDGR